MSLLAKAVVKNKCWVVEDDGHQVGTILTNPQGVVYQHDQTREQFASLKMLSDKYNIIVDKAAPRKIITESNDVYGFPCEYKANNILWDVKHKLPLFTTSNKSKSWFAAGWYIVKQHRAWRAVQNPKLIVLERYKYQGPFHSKEEANDKSVS